ncbi:MAG: aminotransferase class I/II-fold pyridoxal phosphate-dependent enzyme [Chloroflexota bacterium]
MAKQGNTSIQGDSSRAVHAGTSRKKAMNAINTPIVQSATYTFENTADLVAFLEAKTWGNGEKTRDEYGRYGNPSITAVEKRIAALEGGEDAVLFSSGMAAITTLLLTVLKAGQHVVMTDDTYRRTRQFCEQTLGKFGIETTIVPVGDYDALEEAVVKGKTKFIISETPTNPYLRVADLERIKKIAKANRCLTMIDTTFATPINLRPLEWGIDFVIHSATKYLGGHNDVLGGVIIGNEARMKAIQDARGVYGNIVDPQAAFLIERGIKTLGLRVRQQNETALQVAKYLEAHPKIDRVFYPGLASHPDYEVASQQMSGFGGVISFEVAGDLQTTGDFIDSLQIPYIAPSLGGVESLVEQPALMSYYDKTPEERLAVGIHDNLVRFAIGIEDVDDIIDDLEQALASIPERELSDIWEIRFRA